MTEEQIKNYLGVFRILFSEEEIKNIAKSEEKEFVKVVVNKIDKFLTETFKEIKIKDRYKSLTIYSVVDMKKLKKIKIFSLVKSDYDILNDLTIQDSYNKIFNKYLESLNKNDKKASHYVGVFENKKGKVVKTVAERVD